jgi:integrase
MTVSAVLDSAGRRRSPATMSGHHSGRPPRNKGRRYHADPPAVQEIVEVMRQTSTGRHGARVRALIAVLWRGGLRIQEALSLGEQDLVDLSLIAELSTLDAERLREQYHVLAAGAQDSSRTVIFVNVTADLPRQGKRDDSSRRLRWICIRQATNSRGLRTRRKAMRRNAASI